MNLFTSAHLFNPPQVPVCSMRLVFDIRRAACFNNHRSCCKDDSAPKTRRECASRPLA